MLELRVLNGLHRGAAIALDGEALTIGSRESSDVVLIDPGVESQHATIESHAGIWCVAPAKGQVRTENGQALKEPLEIAEGLRLLLGGVWIGFAHETSPWSSLEPLPAVPALADMAEDVADDTAMAAEAGSPVPTAKKSAPPKQKKKVKRGMLLRIGGIVGLGSVVATWTLANAFAPDSNKPATPPAQAPASAQAQAQPPARAAAAASPAAKPAAQEKAHAAVPPLPGGMPAAKASKPVPEKPAKLNREELAAAFSGMLLERDLARRVQVTTRSDGWLVEGDLDEEERQRFERALAKFEAEYDPPFPIRANFVSAANMLPFKIVAIVGGRTPRIVTSRGDNLFVGQELNGYRLVSIEGNKIQFDGKRKLQVTW